jgi:hypothetical protein
MGPLALIRRHLARHVVGYLALFVALGGTSYAAVQITGAQIADGTIRSRDIRNGTIHGADVAKGTLRARNFAGGLPAGARGPAGPAGADGARGPSFGAGTQVANVNNIACDTPTVVGTSTVTVSTPSRIWVHGHGTLSDDGSPATTYGMWIQLRDAAGTTPLAASASAWDNNAANAGADDALMPLSVDGVLLAEVHPLGEGAGSTAYVAQPGTYQLRLVVDATDITAPCTTTLPDFGDNQGAGLDFVLLGTTP